MGIASLLPRGLKKALQATSLLLIVLLFIPMATGYAQDEAENAELKRNLCGGANLSLSAGGNEEDGYNRSCDNPSDGTGNPAKNINTRITGAIDILSVIIGIIAVVVMIIGGLRFITSGGDSGQVSSAKNMVIYAIVGLIVVALAQFLVKFVIKEFTQ